MTRIWWLPVFIILAGLGLGAASAGRVLSPLAGFAIFSAAAAIGLLLGFGLGGLGLYRLFQDSPTAGRTLATAAGPLFIGLAVLASFLSTPGATRNDVTTDLADPPVFLAGPAAGQPYPEDFRVWHRSTYLDLAAQRLPMQADAAFAKARALAESRGWTVAAEDREKGMIQALSRTALFRFEDDVLIRIRASGAESVIDMRSRSRVGRGDRGVNARRIRDFLDAMKGA
ncbi:MAG: DUF1499 domain-containing protein [Alphaproteobacteria bacterium]|nr:DUF1499 domain-containing protein [Alphaproteobacteria bacterium]